ncbi:alkaline phosphatase family protein [Salimicrobium halophilum]|uniref:Predicted pyrophosphatase or phosphodiesterase, AlkP superfamily n=1 Tax=Salimicrobium halophilum TaxID=86666 RepID=A0A1G8QZD1_9BACI|nr:alkaline phosphatase family protein [Salimicrobium halophilum]SDJ10079.1 Predicted pyrophosphatase or phosphodiesterase, AlkP superfamily [Salimicrobium halophilum]
MTLIIIAFFVLLLLVIYIYSKRRLSKIHAGPDGHKRIIVLIIDSLMDEPLQKAIKEGKAPALEFFMGHGRYFPDIVSAYPTMSVAIDTTLLTGTQPDEHKIPGLVWYDTKNKELISYGSAAREIMMLGIRNVLKHSLYELNNEHISRNVKTIHEELRETASINALVYRGRKQRYLHPPGSMTMTGILPPSIPTSGTHRFSFGALSRINPSKGHSHFWQAFGFNDAFTTAQLTYLIRQQKLPPFTIAYFPHNDKIVHKKGPSSIAGIKDTDRKLQTILDSYHTWEEALKDAHWVIMGDSGQARVGYQDRDLIDLRSLLKQYRIPELSTTTRSDAQLVLALNERMAYVYVLDEDLPLETIAETLRTDERIGFVAWRNGRDITVRCARTMETFSFRTGEDCIDEFNQKWSINGDPGVLDITIGDRGQLEYGNYPDALGRLSAAFYSHEGRYLVVDALPGYEFQVKGSPTHKGGASHGSLHKDDSLVPMIVTGTTTSPEHKRIVDLKQWLLSMIRTD